MARMACLGRRPVERIEVVAHHRLGKQREAIFAQHNFVRDLTDSVALSQIGCCCRVQGLVRLLGIAHVVESRVLTSQLCVKLIHPRMKEPSLWKLRLDIAMSTSVSVGVFELTTSET